MKACKSKFPKIPKKGTSRIFGPQNYGHCILKFGKRLTEQIASALIMSLCVDKFEKTNEDGKVGLELNDEVQYTDQG